jgi:hypothetical protein
MSDLAGLKSMGMVVDPAYMGEWPLKVGQYMLNFGSIELLSFQYLALLESDRDSFKRNLGLLLGDRIKRVLVLVEASSRLNETHKLELQAAWGEVQQLSLWRNRIAHNPVLPTWNPRSDAENSPPDLLGIPDMKQLKTSNVSDSISIEGMNKLIDESASLGQRLHVLSSALKPAA